MGSCASHTQQMFRRRERPCPNQTPSITSFSLNQANLSSLDHANPLFINMNDNSSLANNNNSVNSHLNSPSSISRVLNHNKNKNLLKKSQRKSDRSGSFSNITFNSNSNFNSSTTCNLANVHNSSTHTSTTNNNMNYNLSLISPYHIPPTGKNKRLRKDFCKYLKCDKYLSEQELQAKREEFWDTAPVFDGKVEIWQALKSAVEACEAKNFQLAQAIIDSANIILPNGFLNDCYDELGNRYQIPIYVLVKPSNLLKKSTKMSTNQSGADISMDEDSSSTKQTTKAKNKKKKTNRIHDEEDEENVDHIGHLRRSIKLKKKLFGDSNRNSNKSGKQEGTNKLPAVTKLNEPIQIKLRIAQLNDDENDIKMVVHLNQTVLELKNKIKELTTVDTMNQRIYFGGKLLRDKEKLKVHRIRKNVVIQLVLREEIADLKQTIQQQLRKTIDEFKLVNINEQDSTNQMDN